ncbi:hypothetical protein LCGC14_2587260, partial [marine sediment metagenome]
VYNLRYIQVTIENMPTDPIITQIMLLRKHTTPRNHSIKKSAKFQLWYTTVAQLSGPNDMTYSNFRRPIWIMRNHYPLRGQGDITLGRTIFNDCRGRLQPFLYTDGISNDTYLCKFTKDAPRVIHKEHDHDEITYELAEIYRIQSGYTT